MANVRGYNLVDNASPRKSMNTSHEIELPSSGIIHRSIPLGDADDSSLLSSSDESSCTSVTSRGTRLSPVRTLMEWFKKLSATFGTPLLTLVAVIYWAQGFKSFSSLATNYMFKDEFKLDPGTSQALTTTMSIPWGIKPLYGILSDSLPILGYRRRPYLLLFGSISCWAYLMLSIPKMSPSAIWTCFFLFCNNLSTAFNDVVIDARIVEVSRLDPIDGANDLQTLSWSMLAVGGVMGSILSGPATDMLGARWVYLIASIGPILVIVLTCRIPEERAQMQTHGCLHQAKRQTNQLLTAVKYPRVWRSALWIFLSGAAAPSFGQLTFYYITDILHFTPEFLGLISAIGYVFLIFGTVIYNTMFKHVPFRKIFFWSQIALAIISSADLILVTRANLKLGIPDKIFVLGDEVISDVVSRIQTMPVLVLCAKICPKGIEGTLFALLMSISNFSSSVSSYFGALLCHLLGISRGHYSSVWLAVALRSICKLLPIFCLSLVPNLEKLPSNEGEDEDAEEMDLNDERGQMIEHRDVDENSD